MNDLKATIYVVRIKEKDDLESSYSTWYDNQSGKCFDVISHPQYDFVVTKSLGEDSEPLYISKVDCILLGEIISSQGHVKCLKCNKVFPPGYKKCIYCCDHSELFFNRYSDSYTALQEVECEECGKKSFTSDEIITSYKLIKII
jgi:hypothetical protein